MPFIIGTDLGPHDPFISRDDLTNYLGRDVTLDDGALIAVDAACDTIRTVAGQTFNQVIGDSVILDGTGTDCLVLPQRPVTNAGTVVVAGGTITDYTLAEGARLIRGTAGSSWGWCSTPTFWPMGRQNVQVTYDHGYTTTEFPRDVRMVALALASRIIVQGVKVYESVGDVQYRYAGPAMDLTVGEQMILYKYRATRSF